MPPFAGGIFVYGSGLGDIPAIKQSIRKILGREQVRLTPQDLTRRIGREFRDPGRSVVREAVRQMVRSGELVYTQHCGTTHVQMGGAGALVLAAGENRGPVPLEPVASRRAPVIRLAPGLAFGAGDHPTTCLVLDSLVETVRALAVRKTPNQLRVLDVGTGSGVLAIGAAMLGVGWSLGIDIDPASCVEAAQNVAANETTGKVSLVAGTLEAIGGRRYDLVMANLRPPTLVALMPRMADLVVKNGYLILSGFRPDEIGPLKAAFPREMVCTRMIQNRGWSALVAGRI